MHCKPVWFVFQINTDFCCFILFLLNFIWLYTDDIQRPTFIGMSDHFIYATFIFCDIFHVIKIPKSRPRNFRTESLFSFNFPRIVQNSVYLCTEILQKWGKLRENSSEKAEARKWVYFSTEILRKWGKLRLKFCGKNLGMEIMEMSLFLYRNSVEIRETEGKFCGKNIGMEMSLFLYGILRKWGKLRQNHVLLTFVLLYVDSLIGNGTWKNGRQQKIPAIFEISGGHNFSWPRIFN